MGIVYRARDNELEETVALKILPENLSQNPEALARFRAEARSARRLAHPNIVRIHDIGEEMGRKYISMEFVEGTDLKRFFRMKGRLSAGEVAAVMAPIARALDYAHGMGIVHRDIKPANIMLARDMTPKVSDFGIAKLLESTGETLAGSVIGTPLYMSPEQVLGEPIDGRADIYSLGVVMYEMLSGKPPFHEGDLAYQHVHNEPRPLDGVAPAMAEIVLKCLAKDRDRRWKNGSDLAKALEDSGLAASPPDGHCV
jgi:serine/threonine-protein kinase